MSQLDLFGGARPVEELDWPVRLRDLAVHERELGARLTADEAGAWLHGQRGKHDEETRCDYCTTDGRELLNRLHDRHARPLDDAGDSRGSSPRLADTPASSSGSRTSGAGRARSTDPPTSHAAAASVKGLTETKATIVELFRKHGPMTDVDLVDRYIELRPEPGHPREVELGMGGIPPATPSSIRTRRSELERDGIVLDTGRKATLQVTGRKAIIWALVETPRSEYDPEPEL